jgi:hypothetical protein
MNLLYYKKSQEQENAPPPFEALGVDLPQWHFLQFSSLAKLTDVLRLPLLSFKSVVILHIGSEQEVKVIQRLADLFHDFYTILIVSPESADLYAQCRSLFPRITLFEEPDRAALVSILEKVSRRLMEKNTLSAQLPAFDSRTREGLGESG